MAKVVLLQGTLDLLIISVLARGLHGHGIAERFRGLSNSALKPCEGSHYPALYRMEVNGWIKRAWA